MATVTHCGGAAAPCCRRHCSSPPDTAESPAKHVEIWFDADVQSGIPGNGYPLDGDVGGTPFTHPQYNANAFYLFDLGVVVLDKPLKMKRYGSLPGLNVLDGLQPGSATTFTAVGYGGFRRVSPTPLRLRRVRCASAWSLTHT